ncbi:MAG: extracellular solute-binding protein family 1 [Conexibacter sp.]|jgi:ABC-type glycerol-3-phosphate transport system substrate-binding protein|nr:extracellular solute-binding protein family 1 [Conexibacter sp.]
MTRYRLHLLALAAVVLAAAALAGCGSSKKSGGGSSTSATTTAAKSSVSGSISVTGIWTGDEQRSFQAVIGEFNKTYPKVTVRYQAAGDNLPTVVSTAVQGGNPPDIATIAQPGLIEEFQRKGAAKPIDFARATITANYPPDFVKLGTLNGHLYSFVYKGANKSTVWYNVAALKNAGVTAPKTWADFLTAARTVKASGTPAYSIGGADGWTLTDLFENIYLRQAGPQKYDQLTKHQIKWTDPSVAQALRMMAQVIGDQSNVNGGKAGALQTDFPTSVENVFTDPPRAAMVIEGDFVPGVVATKTKLRAGSGYSVFPFPAIGSGGANVVVGGGDSITVFRDTPAVRAFVTFLASPQGAEAWARRGGFSSPNKSVPASTYPDDITRTVAAPLASAQTFRFDMSDLEPASFGGTPGQGEWKILQDFLNNPSNVSGTQAQLEAAASKAFK